MNLGLKAVAVIAPMLFAEAAAAAPLTFDFSTFEPFVGGNVSFTYAVDSPPPFETFIESSSLSSFSPRLARVRFGDTCVVFGPSAPVACDRVEVIVNTSFGSTHVVRYFQDGALVNSGTYSQLIGSNAQLTVSEVATAVPEPASWIMMLLGFGAVGSVLRSRKPGKVNLVQA